MIKHHCRCYQPCFTIPNHDQPFSSINHRWIFKRSASNRLLSSTHSGATQSTYWLILRLTVDDTVLSLMSKSAGSWTTALLDSEWVWLRTFDHDYAADWLLIMLNMVTQLQVQKKWHNSWTCSCVLIMLIMVRQQLFSRHVINKLDGWNRQSSSILNTTSKLFKSSSMPWWVVPPCYKSDGLKWSGYSRNTPYPDLSRNVIGTHFRPQVAGVVRVVHFCMDLKLHEPTTSSYISTLNC